MDDAELRPTGLTAGRAALIGVVALAAALAAGHLVAALVSPGASPFVAVGNSAIDLSPAWLTDFAKNAFGTANKLVLLLGMAVVLVGLAALAGLLARRRPLPGLLVIGLLGAVGVAAVLTRPAVGPLGVLAPATATLVGAVVFGWPHRLATAAQTEARAAEKSELARRNAQLEPPERPTRATGSTDSRRGSTDSRRGSTDSRRGSTDSRPGSTDSRPGPPERGEPSRRRLLLGSAGVLAGAGVAGGLGQWLAGPDVEASRRAIGRLRPTTRAPAIPAGADFAQAGTPTVITPNADFYTIHTALTPPRIAVEQWRLRLHGLVDKPLTLTYDQLRRRPLVERTLTLSCVSNPVGGDLISTANWIGVDLGDLLREAGVQRNAEQLFSTSHDGFTAGTPVDVVLERDRGAMLALAMNGEPLPVEHGFPVRMIVPGLYGFVSATKWLVDLELTTWDARTPYWLPRGWAREAPVKTQSRIDSPDDGASVEPGKVVVAGTAWAPHTGIDAVEVRVGSGPWQRAELAAEVSKDTWRMWRAEVELGPGEHPISCRAIDRSGYTQTAASSPVAPDGATGRHQVRVTAS